MAKQKEPTTPAPLTTDLRGMLKEIVHKELAALPDTLASLDPAQRLNIVCKLIGYVLPKVEAVKHHQGEPSNFEWGD